MIECVDLKSCRNSDTIGLTEEKKILTDLPYYHKIPFFISSNFFFLTRIYLLIYILHLCFGYHGLYGIYFPTFYLQLCVSVSLNLKCVSGRQLIIGSFFTNLFCQCFYDWRVKTIYI